MPLFSLQILAIIKISFLHAINKVKIISLLKDNEPISYFSLSLCVGKNPILIFTHKVPEKHMSQSVSICSPVCGFCRLAFCTLFHIQVDCSVGSRTAYISVRGMKMMGRERKIADARCRFFDVKLGGKWSACAVPEEWSESARVCLCSDANATQLAANTRACK